MQVSATLIAAQQAAREAQARFQAVHAPQPAQAAQKTSFASALGDRGFHAASLETDRAPAASPRRPGTGRAVAPRRAAGYQRSRKSLEALAAPARIALGLGHAIGRIGLGR